LPSVIVISFRRRVSKQKPLTHLGREVLLTRFHPTSINGYGHAVH
jgi:hypothetical protein